MFRKMDLEKIKEKINEYIDTNRGYMMIPEDIAKKFKVDERFVYSLLYKKVLEGCIVPYYSLKCPRCGKLDLSMYANSTRSMWSHINLNPNAKCPFCNCEYLASLINCGISFSEECEYILSS